MKREIALATTLLLTACGSDGSGDSGTGPDAAAASGAAPGAAADAGPPTIFTILLENHDYAEIVGNTTDAPYLNSLIDRYALATNYHETGEPSLPNYLNLISGDNQYPGVVDVWPTFQPYFPSKADNLGHQMTEAGIPWRSYQESMGEPCLLKNAGNFAVRHDPFLYFDDIQNGPDDLCKRTNVDYSQFEADLDAGTYRYMWITPNLIDDGHNPRNHPVDTLKACDAWMAREVPVILASDAWKNGGVLFITWDEAEGRNGHDDGLIPMIVVSPRVHGPVRSDTHFTHSSYLATVEDLLGLPRLPTVADAPTLAELLR
jgi:hypothetical protein